MPYNFARVLGQGLREVLSSDTPKAGFPIRTDAYRKFTEFEMSEHFAADTESGEASESEEEDETDESVNESEDLGQRRHIEIRLQHLGELEIANKTTDSGEGITNEFEHHNQTSATEDNRSHLHNEKTGFSVEPSSEALNFEAIFTESFDDDDFDEEGSDDENSEDEKEDAEDDKQ